MHYTVVSKSRLDTLSILVASSVDSAYSLNLYWLIQGRISSGSTHPKSMFFHLIVSYQYNVDVSGVHHDHQTY